MKNIYITRQARGFTLIELTVVLFIVGLLLAGLLLPLREGIQSERRVKVDEQLKEIESALYGYAMAQGRLPCPDCRSDNMSPDCIALAAANPLQINDGIEDFDSTTGTGTNCSVDFDPVNEGTVVEGNLPWVTLGVKSLDEWDSWFTYAVTDSVADKIGSNTPGNTAPLGLPVCNNAAENLTSIDICPVGNIDILNISDSCPFPLPAGLQQETIAQDVFAVVISHGANVIRGAQNTGIIAAPNLCSEIENYNQDSVFISSSYINPGEAGVTQANAPSPYGIDDLIIWISPNQLKNKLVQAGRLP